MEKAQSGHRPYIYELDLVRAVTALAVVAVHVLVFTSFLNSSTQSQQLQAGVTVAFHFTRAVFMFVTAFALVYVYHGKTFSLKRFWSKRAITTLLPYTIWTIIYVWLNADIWATTSLHQTPLEFIALVGTDLLNGSASYQLYYILVTLQFYIVFPLFLCFIVRTARHPWIVLTLSLCVQIALFAFSYTYLQRGTLASSGFWQVFLANQNSMFFLYEFYFTLGGMAALYYRQISAILLRHSRLVCCSLSLGLAVLGFHFVYQVRIEQNTLSYATSVFQPVLALYSSVVIVFLFWVASSWAQRHTATGQPHGYRFWHLISDASFGVYLIHPIFLTSAIKWILPLMPTVWPVAVREILVWGITAGAATSLSLLLIHTPVLSYLVGRGWLLPRPLHVANISSQSQLGGSDVSDVVARPQPQLVDAQSIDLADVFIQAEAKRVTAVLRSEAAEPTMTEIKRHHAQAAPPATEREEKQRISL